MKRWPILIVPLLLGLGGCSSPLDAPSAFSGERYLCTDGERDLFDQLLEQCRQLRTEDHSCAGVLSFQGVIDEHSVVVDAPILRAGYLDQTEPAGATRAFSLASLAPYFKTDLHMVFVLDPSTGELGGPPTWDTAPWSLLSLEARGGSRVLLLTDEQRDIQLRTAEELRVVFSANLRGAGRMEGCYHAFPEAFAP